MDRLSGFPAAQASLTYLFTHRTGCRSPDAARSDLGRYFRPHAHRRPPDRIALGQAPRRFRRLPHRPVHRPAHRNATPEPPPDPADGRPDQPRTSRYGRQRGRSGQHRFARAGRPGDEHTLDLVRQGRSLFGSRQPRPGFLHAAERKFHTPPKRRRTARQAAGDGMETFGQRIGSDPPGSG